MHIICLVLWSFYISGTLGSAPQCFKCDGISSPSFCNVTEACARNEICYTRDITYEDGRQAYRMGCQDTNVCRLLKQPQSVIGRRASMNPAPCFQCCQSSLCNKNICNDVSGQTTLSTTLPASTTQSKSCPTGYINGPDSCLLYNSTRMQWVKAWKNCIALNGQLVTVDSAEKSRFLANYMPMDNNPVYWTGGLYDNDHDVWLWRDGTIVNMTMWAKGNPVAYTSDPLCIKILRPMNWPNYPRGSLFSDYCSVNEAFICEIPYSI